VRYQPFAAWWAADEDREDLGICRAVRYALTTYHVLASSSVKTANDDVLADLVRRI
jgi:hypothetical protein